MCDYPFFIPQVVLFANSSLFWFKVTNEHREFRNYLCERYNSRFKNTGQERMWVRNKASVTNLNTLAHISLLAVAVAAVTSHSGQSYRKLKTAKRIA